METGLEPALVHDEHADEQEGLQEGPELLERSKVDAPAQKLPPTQMDLF